MMMALLLSYVAVICVGFIHYVMMSRINVVLQRWLPDPDRRLLGLLSVIFVVHMIQAGVFAVAFVLGQEIGLGGFKPDKPLTFLEIYYFSLVNYTTLGLGDIYPSEHLRIMAGIEAFIGFLLLSCSASLLFNLVSEKQTRLQSDNRQ